MRFHRPVSPYGLVRIWFTLLLLAACAGAAATQEVIPVEPIEISVRAGRPTKVPINLGTDSRSELSLQARIEPSKERSEEDLRIKILPGLIRPGPDGRILTLQIAAMNPCCRETYDTAILVKTLGGGGKTARLPLRIKVQPSFACIGTWVGFGLIGMSLWYYLQSMYFHCDFLSPNQLASRLYPKKAIGDQKETPVGSAEEVRLKISSQFQIWPRVQAWFRANPLVFSLPGKRYKEAVRLDLGRRDYDDVILAFVGVRDAFAYFQERSDEAKGKLFASADDNGRISIFGHEDDNGRVCFLEPSRPLKRVMDLTRKTEFSVPKSLDYRSGKLESWIILPER